MKMIYIAAGGTAGHINAAKAIGEVAVKARYQVKYVSGTRYLDTKLFAGEDAYHLDSRPLRTKNPFKLISSLISNTIAFIILAFKLLRQRPVFVIGCGGYVCGPVLLAAWVQFIPVFVLEQNAVMGVTNKILSRFSKRVFTNFHKTKGAETINSSKIVVVGNPIRSNITYQENIITPGELRLFVFGGSLGAKQINQAIAYLVKFQFDYKIKIIHQVGKDNENLVDYSDNQSVEYQSFEYIDDIESKYAWANALVTRAGASTVSELRVVQRPAIIIPFPFATDNHQHFNALELKEEGLFPLEVLDYKLTPESLAEQIYTHLNTIYRSLNQNIKVEHKFIDSHVSEKIIKEVKACTE